MAQITTKKQLKNQLLQNKASVTFSETPQTTQTKEIKQPQKQIDNTVITKELRATALHILLIALLFVLAVVVDSRYPFLEDFGDKIYAWLRLGN